MVECGKELLSFGVTPIPSPTHGFTAIRKVAILGREFTI
jgi:hypothetical protein